jgi:alkylation response protein AidB-like acyl-CoA dehydrogenase
MTPTGMDLDLSDDQIALRDGIAAMLSARVPIERVRAGFDRALFAELADAGVFSLRADGFSWSDCVVVFEQLGRACVPGPLVSSLLAGDGRITGVLEGGWVEHLRELDVVVVPGEGTLDPASLDAEPSSWPLDPATPIARVDAPPPTQPADIDWTQWQRAGAVLTAAFQVGLTDRTTELSVAYAKAREQFDRPIAAFQAIKHLCADMLVRADVARAATYAAGAHLDAGDALPGLDRAISGAKLLAGEAAIVNGKTATQVHGGMGFTWEVDVHLYLKRAWVLDTHFGSSDHHADRVAELLPS